MTEHSRGRAIVTASGTIITCILIGDIDGTITRKSMQETRAYAAKIRATGQKPRLFIDISKIKKQSSGARREAKTLGLLDFEKIAVSGGSGLILALGRYIAKVGGMSDYTRFFRTKVSAKSWLNGKETEGLMFYEKQKYLSAGLILLLAGTAVAGWAYDTTLPRLILNDIKSMNPMMSVTLVILVLSLLLINRTVQNSKFKRGILLLIAIWSVFFGFSVLLRHYTSIDLKIDLYLLFDKTSLLGMFSGRVAFGSGLLTILAGSMLAFFALKKKPWWILYIFYTLAFSSFAIVFLAIMGYAFGIPVLYRWNNQLPIPVNTVLAFAVFTFTLVSLMKPVRFTTWAMKQVQNYWQGIIIFFILILSTGILMQQLQRDNATTVNNLASDAFLKTENNIRSRLALYSTVLSGYKAFMNSSTDITPEEFRSYYLNSGANNNYAGFIGIAYAPIITDEQVKKFTTQTRARATATSPAYVNYTIFQTDSSVVSQVHYPLMYVQPASQSSVYGFDLSTETVRRTTIEKARKTGTATISDIIDLGVSAKADGQPYTKRPGFFIALSLGDTTARSLTRINTANNGFVFAYFENDLLFANIFRESLSEEARYTLTDTQSGKVIYSTVSRNVSDDAEASKTATIRIGGREWELRMATSPDFALSNIAQAIPGIVLLGGILVALLAAGIVILQLHRRDRALSLAEHMTADLNSERNLAIAVKNKDEAILSSIGDAVFAIDLNEHITLFNSVSEKITGFSADEVMGKSYKKFMIFTDDKAHTINNDFIEKVLAGKKAPLSKLTVLKRKDGRYVYVANSAAPIRDASGHPLGVIIVFRDITDEQKLDQAKNEFVSLASHQLRTPLSAINWYSELLLDGDAGELSKDQISYIQEIFNGNQRMIELVNSLLDVSRIDLGKIDNIPVPLNTVELIENIEKEMTPLIIHKNIIVKKNIARSPIIYAEPKLVRMIVQNILSNAIKYTPNGGTVHITAAHATRGKVADAHIHSTQPHILLTIKDTGYGIPKGQQENIYTKMFRANNVRVMDVEGTGLGLFIVKEVVDKLHGRIWFESVENKGTTFHVILPVKTKSTNA